MDCYFSKEAETYTTIGSAATEGKAAASATVLSYTDWLCSWSQFLAAGCDKLSTVFKWWRTMFTASAI